MKTQNEHWRKKLPKSNFRNQTLSSIIFCQSKGEKKWFNWINKKRINLEKRSTYFSIIQYWDINFKMNNNIIIYRKIFFQKIVLIILKNN